MNELETNLKKFYSLPFAKACANGFSALVVALKLASIGHGDDVLVPSFTMAAVANAVLTVGGKPIFVDCDEDALNPSPNQFDMKMTPHTKALIVTHTYGYPADCFSLAKLCERRNIILIEDIAEAIGVKYNDKLVGTFGDFACASLYANKIITAGDGGFVLSKHKNLENRAASYLNHGFSTDFHFIHFEQSGNYKMSGLQAAFAAPAVEDIPIVIKDRERISALYRKHLEGLEKLSTIPKNKFGIDAPWMFGVLAESKDQRKRIRSELAHQGIETRDFFFPLHIQPMIIDKFGLTEEQFPNAVFLGTRGFYLPTFFGLKEEEIEFVCSHLKKATH